MRCYRGRLRLSRWACRTGADGFADADVDELASYVAGALACLVTVRPTNTVTNGLLGTVLSISNMIPLIVIMPPCVELRTTRLPYCAIQCTPSPYCTTFVADGILRNITNLPLGRAGSFTPMHTHFMEPRLALTKAPTQLPTSSLTFSPSIAPTQVGFSVSG